MDYGLKRIHPDGIDAALDKADRYRELNQPAEAESICRDVLVVDAENQLGLRVLGLALTDQFGPTTDVAYYWGREMTEQMALDNSPHLTETLMLNGERTPFAENAERVLADGDEIYLLAPLAGG